MLLSWHWIMFCTLFWCRIRKMLILEVYIYFPWINTHRRATAPLDNTPVMSTLQRKHWTTGLYHVYSVLNLSSYGELSIYVLLLLFGLSHRYNIQKNTVWLFFTALHFVKRLVWYIFVFTQYIYYRYFFCSWPLSRHHVRHRHGWVRYIDTTKITVLRFVWDCLVLLNTVIIVNSFVWGQHRVFIILVVTCERAILILQKLLFGVCHWCYCLLIYDNCVILFYFILNWPMVQWWNGG